MRKNVLLLLSLLLSVVRAAANDGIFYVNGNEISPISETDIRIDKEILDICKISDSMVAVSVYYEFFNPGAEKTLKTGFEALPPYNDDDEKWSKLPVESSHPYMHNFCVMLNDSILKYHNKIIKTSDGLPEKFVYLFNARFKSGRNTVRHSYICDLSMNVGAFYQFYYVLDAAMRWAGGNIADFTLNVNMGMNQAFLIPETFFKGTADWTLTGVGKIIESKCNGEYEAEKIMKCYVRQGTMVYHKQNFKPAKNLYISCIDGICTWNIPMEGGYNVMLPESETYIHPPFTNTVDTIVGADKFSQRVIHNMKYARKGYIFKDKSLRDYFNNIEWYMPDPNYVPGKNDAH